MDDKRLIDLSADDWGALLGFNLADPLAPRYVGTIAGVPVYEHRMMLPGAIEIRGAEGSVVRLDFPVPEEPPR